MTDFTTLDYLRSGNEKQQRAYNFLTEQEIFKKLGKYSPVLAGTIPIEIDTEESDLDIICEVKDNQEFENLLNTVFSEFKIRIEKLIIDGEETVVGNFESDGFLIEIFGQNKLVTEQNAYRHMIAEHSILQEKGEDFRQKIIALKEQGIKTEPAFGVLLGLENPYKDLLKF